MQKTDYYTTNELAKLTPYKTRRTLLQALHKNQNKNDGVREGIVNKFNLTAIWNTRFKFGKEWLFKKEEIDLILGGKNE